jgi:hypothetical protein
VREEVGAQRIGVRHVAEHGGGDDREHLVLLHVNQFYEPLQTGLIAIDSMIPTALDRARASSSSASARSSCAKAQ